MPAWISDFLKKGPCTEEQRTLSDKLDNIGEKEDKDDDDENSVRAQPTRSSSSQGPSDDDDDDGDDVIDNDDGNDPSLGADTDQMDNREDQRSTESHVYTFESSLLGFQTL